MTQVSASERQFSRAGDAAVAIVLALVLVHLARLLLEPEADFRLVAEFAFTPANFSAGFASEDIWRAARQAVERGEASSEEIALLVGLSPRWWTPLTYSLLHGGFTHIAVNGVWLLAFGTAVCRRFGAVRFVVFYAFAAIVGALAFYVVHPLGLQPVIGASAAISGAMGAAVRFAFAPDGPLGGRFSPPRDLAAYRRPAPPLRALLTDRRTMTFVALWFAANFLFGAVAPTGADGASIAWEAHIGGFLAGALGFALFDRPVVNARRGGSNDESGLRA
ncbi:MAG: rhomboid family intramembrane serine protease [Methylobacteriaceae bacterium]|nr:rhomboid family intramembrane serine protease [Methylobacteriaceae bacterium]